MLTLPPIHPGEERSLDYMHERLYGRVRGVEKDYGSYPGYTIKRRTMAHEFEIGTRERHVDCLESQLAAANKRIAELEAALKEIIALRDVHQSAWPNGSIHSYVMGLDTCGLIAQKALSGEKKEE
jgi:predicted RNase H-like nuclease (RuvC/YqgF family)